LEKHNTTKEAIEIFTAQGFLDLYNNKHGTNFEIKEQRDAPDIHCRNSDGKDLFLEITLTQDYEGDAPVMLGQKTERIPHKFTSMKDEVVENLKAALYEKLKKDYGNSVALVIRDISGVDWDWNLELPSINYWLRSLPLKNPYDMGIWIINNDKTKIYRIDKLET